MEFPINFSYQPQLFWITDNTLYVDNPWEANSYVINCLKLHRQHFR
jgi:hypothetical protein